jgi:CRISPR-associated protein Cmr2
MNKLVDVYAFFWQKDKPHWQKIRSLNTNLTFRQKVCALYLLKDKKEKNNPPGKSKLKDIIFNTEFKKGLEKYLNPVGIYKNELGNLKDIAENLFFAKINYPKYSVFIEVILRLKRPYFSKDDEFYIISNPIVKENVFKIPIVRSTTWKGALRNAFKHICSDEIIEVRLFGSKKDDENDLRQGRLFFYPTFFNRISLDVITPLSREKRTPARGPIYFEIVPEGTNGCFRLLYYPFDLVAIGEFDKIENEMREDLEFLSKALKKMFYEIGFSAKKTSGFGTAEINKIEIRCGDKLKPHCKVIEEIFRKEFPNVSVKSVGDSDGN